MVDVIELSKLKKDELINSLVTVHEDVVSLRVKCGDLQRESEKFKDKIKMSESKIARIKAGIESIAAVQFPCLQLDKNSSSYVYYDPVVETAGREAEPCELVLEHLYNLCMCKD